MINVVLADDDRMIREALAALLEIMKIKVVGQAEDGNQAVRVIEKTKPDVALLDVRMPNASGLDALREIRKRNLATRVIFLTTFDDNTVYAQALEEGLDGWLLKGESGDDLAKAIHDVAEGKKRLLPEMQTDDAPLSMPHIPIGLTPREVEILRLVARGMSNKEIGNALGTAEGTVKNQISSAKQKLDAENRTDCVRKAMLLGLL
jgi:DNA-binding NarL/FixJ family response regulator